MKDAFRRREVLCAGASGLHRMAYVEWGQADNARVLVCVHGLTRCGRDFDALARSLLPHYRVVCPDVAGRGDSEWLADPMEYGAATYVNDMVTLIARLDVETVDWVGTSMGGLIGMAIASLPRSPIRKLVLNDVGPLLTAQALERIGSYVGKAPRFDSIEAAERYVRLVAASFGPHSDAEWRTLTENVIRQDADGLWRMNYDPAIAARFTAEAPYKDVELWAQWDAIRCPTLALRGEQSDLLTRQTLQRMAETGPKARTLEIAGVGHAPTLMHADQIAWVRDFLLGP